MRPLISELSELTTSMAVLAPSVSAAAWAVPGPRSSPRSA